jgi:TIR domain
MSVIKAFLSYSTKDKKIAGKIKEEFEKIGINLFLAHQDIKVSKEWRKRIKTEIKESKWCLFLITGSFEKSEWTDQEAGMAIAHNREIVSLYVQTKKPYGFLADYQAQKIRTNNIGRLCKRFAEHISETKEGAKLKDGIIRKLYKSKDFDDSRDCIRLLKMFILKTNEKKRVLRCAERNEQVGGGGYNEVREYISKLQGEV